MYLEFKATPILGQDGKAMGGLLGRLNLLYSGTLGSRLSSFERMYVRPVLYICGRVSTRIPPQVLVPTQLHLFGD